MLTGVGVGPCPTESIVGSKEKKCITVVVVRSGVIQRSARQDPPASGIRLDSHGRDSLLERPPNEDATYDDRRITSREMRRASSTKQERRNNL